MCRNLFSLLWLLLFTGILNGQSLWSEMPQGALPNGGERRIVPDKFRSMQLDLNVLQPMLAAAPDLYSSSAPDNVSVLEIPRPDGKSSHFQIYEAAVMAPALQAKYPEIRCYTGRSLEDPSEKIKLDLTPWGFHAMVTSPNHDAYFIDPMFHGNKENYVVYFKKDYKPSKEDANWTCETPNPDNAVELGPIKAHSSAEPDFQGDTQLRRYRLALACTGEYATFHGGTKPLVLAAMNTSINRVNSVYENDFAVTLQIIANNDVLIFLDAATDPYTNNNGGTMLGQNQTTCNNLIGTANYDMGHVFSTGGGGVANLAVICGNSKARGVTGLGAPVGDPFDIDYVAHEMGHQFGGNHTFNNCSGNNGQSSAVETGSGITIMAYAGICGSNNVDAHSLDYFHGYNLTEMGSFIYNGGGNTCPEKIASGNHNPTVEAGPNYTIPKSTPFALTAVGSDMDGDTLTYTWEQMDNGNASSPPQSSNAAGPLFRPFKGTTSPTRVFPRLVDIINNANPTWEKLPGVARVMSFRVSLRDNDWFAGCTDEDDMFVTVDGNSGPFLVTQPNTNIGWTIGSQETVTWDVANTTAAPVSCSHVRILLSTDGGFTYPIVLADNEPNDGMATITVPNNEGTTCRVKVEGMGNIFFDISNANFHIDQPVVPTFFMVSDIAQATVCAGDTAIINLDFTSVLSFNTPADISITGAPAGSTIDITPNPVVPGNAAVVQLSGFTAAMAGTYNLDIEAVAGGITRNIAFTLQVFPGLPATASLLSPADGAIGASTFETLSWNNGFATSALVEVATNPSFSAGSIVTSTSVSDTALALANLDPATVYYWRVTNSNDCGTASGSSVFAFQTGGQDCGHEYSSTDIPVTIDAATVNTIESSLTVADNNVIADVDLSLFILHTYTGDLIASLISPTNDTIQLFDQPGVPASPFGCPGDDALLTFDDQAAQTATDLENMCVGTPPSLSGTFQPIGSLATLNGKSAMGDWRLVVTDNYDEDGGSLMSWSLNFCFPNPITAGSLLTNSPLTVPNGGNGTIDNGYLELSLTGSADQSSFILTALPAHGTLMLNGVALGIGDSFSQDDINNNLVVYTNNGDPDLTDEFHFDALDENNDAWVHNAVFVINVIQNNLAATATQTQDVLCFGAADGEITVDATGLDGNYMYSLNGGVNQSSNVFSGLAAGNYTVVVTGQFGFTVESNQVVIADASEITVSAPVTVNTITVNASGGAGTLEYSLDGVAYQSDNTFSDLANGTYTVYVRDENGCVVTVESIVSVGMLTYSTQITAEVSCAGESDGSITVDVMGGDAPYVYSLNGGPDQSDNTFTSLSAGTYTVVITDNMGLTAETNSIVLADPDPVTANGSAVLNVITVNASGGTNVFQYSLDGGPFQSSNEFVVLASGTYEITVQDENGCTTTTMVTVTIPTLELTASFNSTLACFGAMDGSITANANGGIPPYEYRLDNGAYQMSNVFTGLGAGSYTVWVKDAVGTEVSSMVTISEPTQLMVGVSVSFNDGTVMFSGGTPAYTFTTNAPNPDLQNLPNGTYNVTATDANGCTAVTSFTIDVAPISIPVNGIETTGVSCLGGADGSITINPEGGIPPYEYSLNGGAFQSSNTFSGLDVGPFEITVRDSEGNTVTSPSITLPTISDITLMSNVNGNTITVIASGGVEPYMYGLNGGTGQADGTFENLTPGTYTVLVTDANGCTAVAENLIVASDVVEPVKTWGLSITPNPGNGLFHMTLELAPVNLETQVYDAAGRLLQTLNFTPNGGRFETNLDLRNMPNGTYILRLTDGKQWGGVRLSKME
ncbi:MAG: M12 family metallo-peptidase [Saprospiraceae bacterium]